MRIRVARLVATIMIFLFVVTCIIFCIPLKEVQTQTIETYVDTEMRTETYVVKEPYIEKELRKKSVPIFDGESVVVPGGVDVPFSIDKPNASLIGEFDCPIAGGFYVYSATGVSSTKCWAPRVILRSRCCRAATRPGSAKMSCGGKKSTCA
ncbi:MAG: hypothetical protein FJ008_03725 [Chloroflexi bacterium]|nr:hypothetical protein [Chloroflexota bacterium]MBM3175082.1 hypothetical protein [Chloroflexota bacterium]MBM4449716.1 hypothetical protein [Chloroflexota bacterium]